MRVARKGVDAPLMFYSFDRQHCIELVFLKTVTINKDNIAEK